MKKIVVLTSVIFLVGVLSIGFTVSPVAAADDAVPGVPSGDSVSYDHWSVLNVFETITDMGGGTYKYSYEFTNTEPTAIWHFGVWTTFSTGAVTTFDQTGTWPVHDSHDINAVATEYDARNLDPPIIWLSHTHDSGFPTSPNPIPVGAYVSGFSFTASVLDGSPKLYYYEIYGSYAVTDPEGKLTAIGITVPGDFFVIPEVPFGTAMTFLGMFIALIGFAGFKRFRPKFPL